MTYSSSFSEGTAPTPSTGDRDYIPPAPMVERVETTTITREPQEVERPTSEDLSSHLVSLASLTHQLYTQAHLIHLNVESPIFLSLHKFLKKEYERHISQFDSLAEYVRTLDYLMPMCARGLQQACKNFKHVKSYEMKEMLTTYLKNLEQAIEVSKDLTCTARVTGAPDIENYLAEYMSECAKSAWFIKATLRE